MVKGGKGNGIFFLVFIFCIKTSCCVDASRKGRQLVVSQKGVRWVEWLAKWLGGLWCFILDARELAKLLPRGFHPPLINFHFLFSKRG